MSTILIVGLGSMGVRHTNILKEQYPKIKLIALRHSECEKTDVKKFGLVDCVVTVTDALKFKPEAAIIAIPATKHIDIALALAKAGVHLLIEKPISSSAEGVSTLIELCNNKKLLLMSAYNLRFEPSLIEFRNQIMQQKVGNILSIRAEVGQYLPSWRPENDYSKGVSAQKRLGGGVLLELSHEIDYLNWIFGDYKWVKSHIAKLSNLDIDVEDSANIIFGMGSDKDKEIVVSLNMDFFRHDSTRECTVIGEKGTLRWNAKNGEVLWYAKDSLEWIKIFSKKTKRDYTYQQEIEHFLSAIEKDQKVSITGEEGLKTIEVIEAIHQSHDSGRKVSLQT